MVRLASVLCFVLWAVALPAQDWAPVRMGELYHYATNGGTRLADVARTVRADSITVDSLGNECLHLNRIVTPCSTCIVPPDSLPAMHNGDLKFVWINQPHFLRHTATYFENGHWWLHDTASYCLHTYANTGEYWLFDTLAGTQAIVTANGIQNILGSVDSVKHIALTDGSWIVISKNRGIVTWQRDGITYQLIGWENESLNQILGTKWPRISDLYDGQVDDIYYTLYFYHIQGPGARFSYNYSCLKVVEIIREQYMVSLVVMRSTNWNGTSYAPVLDTLEYANVRMPFRDSEMINLVPQSYWERTFSPAFSFDSTGNLMRYVGYNCSNGGWNSIDTTSSPMNYYGSIFNNQYATHCQVGDANFQSFYCYKVPFRIYRGWDGFTIGYELIDGPNEYVDCTADTSELEADIHLQIITPLGEGHITVKNPTFDVWTINILDATGRILPTIHALAAKQELRIDLENLSTGVYILHATDGRQVITRRVLRP